MIVQMDIEGTLELLVGWCLVGFADSLFEGIGLV